MNRSTDRHCASCDYDLRGLDLPHPCPECGHRNDDDEDRKTTVAWYRSRKGLTASGSPPLFLRFVDDHRCISLARKRIAMWFALPWLCFLLYASLLTSVTVHRTYQRSGATGIDHFTVQRRAPGEFQPRVSGRLVRTSYGLATPRLPEQALGSACVAVCGVTISLGLAHAVLASLVRRYQTRDRSFSLPSAVSWGWFSVPHVILVVGYSAGLTTDAFDLSLENEFSLAGFAAFLIGGAVIAARLSTGCRPPKSGSSWPHAALFCAAWLIAQALPVSAVSLVLMSLA